jgi:hypothetical protein
LSSHMVNLAGLRSPLTTVYPCLWKPSDRTLPSNPQPRTATTFPMLRRLGRA